MSSPDLTSNDALVADDTAGVDGSGRGASRRPGPIVGSLVAVLVVAVALPLIFLPISERVTGAHTAFHVLGILTCLAGIVLLHVLRRGATRTVAVMSWIVTLALAGWLVAHVGELVTVLTEGGIAHDSETFDHAQHVFFASIAVPSWMLTVLSLLVLLVAIAVQAIARRARRARRRVGPAPSAR